MSDSIDSLDLRECPFCAECIMTQAIFCKHCKSDLANFLPTAREGNAEKKLATKKRKLTSSAFFQENQAAQANQGNFGKLLVLALLAFGLLFVGALLLDRSSIGALVFGPKGRGAEETPMHNITEVSPLKNPSPVPSHDNVDEIDKSENISNTIREIIAAQEGGDETTFQNALLRLEQRIKPQPGDIKEASRFNKVGLKALRTSNYDDAVAAFASAVETDPSQPDYLSNLGFAQMNDGDLESSEENLNLSLALAPKRAVAWNDLGLLLAKKDDRNGSVASLLIGFRFTKRDAPKYLKSLLSDKDPAVRSAGKAALDKVVSSEITKTLPSFSGRATATIPIYNEGKTTIFGSDSGAVDTEPQAIEITGAVVDYTTYVSDLQRRIERTWFPPPKTSRPVIVGFKISAQGEPFDLQIEKSCGFEMIDKAILRAVHVASPFGPLPPNGAASINIQLKFLNGELEATRGAR